MRDTEANEGAAGESSSLIDREQPAVLEMGELHSRTNADSPDVSDTDAKLNTALHRAVLSVCGNGKNRAGSYRQLCTLMTSQNIKLNMPNIEGYTAMGLAVEHSHRKCVKQMLRHPLSNLLYLDYYPGDRESTVREIIMDKYPELQPLLPAPLMESLNSSSSDKKLLAALQCDKFKTFRKCLNETNPNPWYDKPYHSSLLEIACQMKKRKQFIKVLLDSGADPNIKNRVTGLPLLHATARSGNFEVLQVLLKKEEINISLKDYKNRTILHWLSQVRERKPNDKYILENCFKLLLDKHHVTKIGIDFRDVSGNTALYIALENGFRDRAKLLLSEGADVSVLENGSKVLLSDTLSILEEVLEDCLLSNDELLTSKDLELRLNKDLLEKIIPRIAETEHLRELLKHPVMSTFLSLKWLNVRFIFFLDMAFYVIFLCFLTAYILLPEPYNTLNDGGATRNAIGPFSFNNGNIISGMNDSDFTSQTNNSSLHIVRQFLAVSLIILWLREGIQLIVHRWIYGFSQEKWVHLLLLIATFISCTDVVGSVVIKLHFSAVALLLGWSELLMISGRLPLLSVHLAMLRTVILTILRLMAGYVTLLIAFAFSFYILFKGNTKLGETDMFANPFISLLKTIVMFTGEYEASSLRFDNLPYTSHVIFVLFVFLVTIVMLNLLVAVSQADAIRTETETLLHLAKVLLISQTEALVSALPQFVKRFVETSLELRDEIFTLHPNRGNSLEYTHLRSLLSIISKKTKPNNKWKSKGIQEESSIFTEKLSALQIRQEELEKKLNSKLEQTQNILLQILDRLKIPESETTRP
jgi:ankyrin repeat protein